MQLLNKRSRIKLTVSYETGYLTVRLRGRNCNPRKLKFSAVCNSIRRFNATAEMAQSH